MSLHWNPEEAVRAHAAATRPDRPERRPVEQASELQEHFTKDVAECYDIFVCDCGKICRVFFR